MIDGALVKGERLWWAPHDSKSFEVVTVTDYAERDGASYIQTESVRTHVKYWNRESRTRELCKREPKRGATKVRPGDSGNTEPYRCDQREVSGVVGGPGD